MNYKFDTSNFPIVKVKIINIINETCLNSFFNEWKQLYQNNKEFTLIFETTDMVQNFTIITHSFKIIEFIKELKRLPKNMKKSIIVVNNDFIKNILFYIFHMETPVCTVYITKPTNIDVLLNQLEFSSEWYSDNIVKISV